MLQTSAHMLYGPFLLVCYFTALQVVNRAVIEVQLGANGKGQDSTVVQYVFFKPQVFQAK